MQPGIDVSADVILDYLPIARGPRLQQINQADDDSCLEGSQKVIGAEAKADVVIDLVGTATGKVGFNYF